jgi:hypothetical protein
MEYYWPFFVVVGIEAVSAIDEARRVFSFFERYWHGLGKDVAFKELGLDSQRVKQYKASLGAGPALMITPAFLHT